MIWIFCAFQIRLGSSKIHYYTNSDDPGKGDAHQIVERFWHEYLSKQAHECIYLVSYKSKGKPHLYNHNCKKLAQFRLANPKLNMFLLIPATILIRYMDILNLDIKNHNIH